MQQRLKNILTEESDKQSGAVEGNEEKVLPRYMAWRPQNYNIKKPVRKVSNNFMQAAAAAKKREERSAKRMQEASPIKSRNNSSYMLSMHCPTEDTRSSAASHNFDSARSSNCSQRMASAQSSHSIQTDFHPQEKTSIRQGRFLALPKLNYQTINKGGPKSTCSRD